MNEYDWFESLMSQAGWTLDQIEVAWQDSINRQSETLQDMVTDCYED